MQSNTHPSKNKTSIIGLLNQPTNITLQNNNLAYNQSDERSQKDNLVQSSKDNNTPSKYSRSNKDKDKEEDMDEEEREGKEGDDKKEETIDHEETIDYETPGINNVPTNTKTKDNLDNNTVYDNTIGDNSKTIAVNKTVADNSTATDNPGNSTNNVAPGENKTGSILLHWKILSDRFTIWHVVVVYEGSEADSGKAYGCDEWPPQVNIYYANSRFKIKFSRVFVSEVGQIQILKKRGILNPPLESKDEYPSHTVQNVYLRG